MVTLIQKSLLIYDESINNYKHEHKINSVWGGGGDKLMLYLEKNELTVPVANLSIVTKFTKTVILDNKISKNNFIVIVDHVTIFVQH